MPNELPIKPGSKEFHEQIILLSLIFVFVSGSRNEKLKKICLEIQIRNILNEFSAPLAGGSLVYASS